MNILTRILLPLATITLLNTPTYAVPTTDLGFIQKPNANMINTSQINKIRLQALTDTATSLGARGGLALQSIKINNALDKESQQLDQIFNFSPLLIDSKILPPVLTMGGNSATISSAGNSLRIASQSYEIVSQAHFVTAPPNWRTYLMMNYSRPSMPDKSLLPTNRYEVGAWNLALKKGWKQGTEQANAIFATNLNRLKRDYRGILLYRKLLSEHLVNPPLFGSATLGITGDSEHMRINDQVLRITQKAGLNLDPNKWTPVVTTDGS